jgi:hypothetical protein
MTASGMPPLTALAGLVSRIAQIMQAGDDPAARTAAAASVEELRTLVRTSSADPDAAISAASNAATSAAPDAAPGTAFDAAPGAAITAAPGAATGAAPLTATSAAPGAAATAAPGRVTDAAPGFDLGQISNALAIFAEWLRAPTPDLELRAAHAMAELQTALGPLVGWDPAREDADRRAQYRREARAALDDLFPDGLGVPSPFDKPKS